MMKALLTAGAITLTMTAAPSSAAVIFSDNFSGEATGINQALDNWNVTAGSVDVIGNGFFDFYPGNGAYLDMDGSTGVAGRIATKVQYAFTNGQQYQLAFRYGRNTDGGVTQTLETLNFGFGTFLGTLGIGPGAIPSLVEAVYTFTAGNTGTSSLFFENLGGDNRGVVIDDIVLSAVPLPAGGLLLIGGIAALAGLRRRKLA